MDMGVLFVLVLIILPIVLILKSKDGDTKKKPGEMPPRLPDNSTSTGKEKPKPEQKLEPDPDSVTIYMNAEQFGDWVCRNCECENPGTNSRCCVCNQLR